LLKGAHVRFHKLKVLFCLVLLAFLSPAQAQIPGLGNVKLCLVNLKRKYWDAPRINKALSRPSRHIPLDAEFNIDGTKITYEEVLRRYCRLILEVGINFKSDGKIILEVLPEHFYGQGGDKSIATLFAEEAYAAGAKYVYIHLKNVDQTLVRVEKSPDQHLSFLPAFTKDVFDQIAAEEDWYRVGLGPPPVMPNAAGMTAVEAAVRNSKIASAASDAEKKYLDKIMAKEMPWNVTVFPTFEYAQRFMADASDPPLVKLYETWKIFIRILGLHTEDPIQFWRAQNKITQGRSARLNELNLKKLHFKTPDGKTDLTVELVQEAGWTASADAKTPDGRGFMGNTPSGEVYTSPHRDGVNGILLTSSPVIIDGKTVEGLWLKFENGLVVDFGATKNEDTIRALLENPADPNFRRAGEIALVDKDSPINKLGRLFLNTLFDENAKIHLALGNAYPLWLSKLGPAERLAKGLNSSKRHIDFMFGTNDMTVTGYTNDETPIVLMSDGKFTDVFPK
jgi:aminopeptidase